MDSRATLPSVHAAGGLRGQTENGDRDTSAVEATFRLWISQ